MINLEKSKKFILDNLVSVISILIAIVSILGSVIFVYLNKCECEPCQECEQKICENEVKNTSALPELEIFKVDVKGAVKKPGVYEVTDSATVNDAINMAGGLSTNGTTTNINLAKKLTNEMVIYVFTKNELTKMQTSEKVVCEVPKCECESLNVNRDICTNPTTEDKKDTTSTVSNDTKEQTSNTANQDDKISINTDSIAELTTLDGIGEAKAQAIIEYRRANGNFTKLEDIMNVSGIGDKAYEKIKDKIKL